MGKKIPPAGTPVDQKLYNELAARYQLEHEALIKAKASLRKWDGSTTDQSYADQFVWEAWDAIKAVLP